jgi:hypothetical protein
LDAVRADGTRAHDLLSADSCKACGADQAGHTLASFAAQLEHSFFQPVWQPSGAPSLPRQPSQGADDDAAAAASTEGAETVGAGWLDVEKLLPRFARFSKHRTPAVVGFVQPMQPHAPADPRPPDAQSSASVRLRMQQRLNKES